MQGEFSWQEFDGTDIGPLKLDVMMRVFPAFDAIYLGIMIEKKTVAIPILIPMQRDDVVRNISLLEGNFAGSTDEEIEKEISESGTWIILERMPKHFRFYGRCSKGLDYAHISFDITMTLNDARKVCHGLKQSLNAMDELDWDLNPDRITSEMVKKYKILGRIMDFYEFYPISAVAHGVLRKEAKE